MVPAGEGQGANDCTLLVPSRTDGGENSQIYTDVGTLIVLHTNVTHIHL